MEIELQHKYIANPNFGKRFNENQNQFYFLLVNCLKEFKLYIYNCSIYLSILTVSFTVFRSNNTNIDIFNIIYPVFISQQEKGAAAANFSFKNVNL